MNKLQLLFLSSLLVLTGCSSKGVDVETDSAPIVEIEAPIIEKEEPVIEDKTPEEPIIDNTETNILIDEPLTPLELLEEKGSPLTTRVIYFDYNSAKVSDDSLAVLQSHGAFISENGSVNVILEGHTDERGSREFNVALGDRRNQTVRRILLLQGASSDQVETVSYGEELPVAVGHDESAWSKNRRVELIYKVK